MTAEIERNHFARLSESLGKSEDDGVNGEYEDDFDELRRLDRGSKRLLQLIVGIYTFHLEA